MGEEKPLPPSEHKLRQLRKRGEVVRVSELVGIIAIIGITLGLAWSVRFVLVAPQLLLQFESLTSNEVEALVGSFVRLVATSLSVPLGIGLVAGCVASLVQTGGFLFSPDAIAFRGERLSPAAAFERWQKGVCELPRRVIELLVLLGVASGALILSNELLASGNVVGSILIPLALMTTAVVATGLLHLLSERREYLRRHGMSFDEARREHKDLEGDPLHRAMRRSLHEALVLGQLEERVKRSKVIVVTRRRSRRG